jgi:C-terminal peptidase prc
MTAWGLIRRAGTGAAGPLSLFLFFISPVRADEPATGKPKPTVAELRASAEAAEKAGDWETAFTAYCHLYVADRSAPDVREKLNIALRRCQQLRRHRDPQFQQFAGSTSVHDALNLFEEVMTRVPVVYVERDRATPQILWENGIEELTRALGNPVFRQAFLENAPVEKVEWFRTTMRMSWAKQNIPDAKAARLALRKLITAAQETFKVRVPSVLAIEMVCGACGGLDEYTIFLNPALSNPDSTAAAPDLVSQGVYLGITDGSLVVVGIASGSWAAMHTSLRKGDHVFQLNGRPMDGATAAVVAEALRSPVGGFHVLDIGPDIPTVQLPVVVPTVYGTRVHAAMSAKDGIGYLRIGSFTANTPRELDEAINSLKGRGVRAVVIDLRGNMGGSFLASVDTTRRLLSAGLIVTTQGQVAEVNNQPFSSDSGMAAHDMPLVLLIDTETASGAEVLAAALKDNNRATLVGMPTFGKGTIQYPLRLVALDDLDENGKPRTAKSGSVRLTIAKLIAPRGEAINGIGITPHILEADPTRQLELAIDKAAELLPAGPRPMPTVMPIIP